MLVLSRKQNQTIVIDGKVEIEVLKIKGNTVRLGIRAPQNLKVLRGELSPFEIKATIEMAESESENDSVKERAGFKTISIAHAV